MDRHQFQVGRNTLKSSAIQETKDKGKALLKISKKKLMFNRDRSEISKFPKEDVKDVQVADSVMRIYGKHAR